MLLGIAPIVDENTEQDAVRLPAGAPIQWARVAIGAGYYDQPHLIRECRAISGLSPSELARERRHEVDPDDELVSH